MLSREHEFLKYRSNNDRSILNNLTKQIFDAKPGFNVINDFIIYWLNAMGKELSDIPEKDRAEFIDI